MRTYYDDGRTCWSGTVTFKRVFTHLLKFHPAEGRAVLSHPLSFYENRPF